MSRDLVYRLVTSFLFVPALIIIATTDSVAYSLRFWVFEIGKVSGGVFFLILIELGIGIGAWEFFTILEAKGMRPYKRLGTFSALLLGLTSYFQSYLFTILILTSLVIVLSISELFRRSLDRATEHISSTIFGVLYLGWLFSHLVLLRELPTAVGRPYHLGASFCLLPFALTWPCDAAAYFVGRKWGKHRLIRRVSPKKSWEGVFGGVFFATVAAFIYRRVYGPYLSVGDCLFLGVAVGFLAQVGDLVESLIKRDAQLKDVSGTIPGHGGVLDRFDSILFTAPFLYYYLRFFAAR